MAQLSQAIAARAHAYLVNGRYRLRQLRHDERGSVTIQEVLWAIAAIAFVAIVTAAITAYLTNKAALIR